MSGPLPPFVADAVLAAADQRRVVLGISGGPGSGKSTLAAALAAVWTDHGAVVVPMDGFHLSGDELAAADLTGRKGAPETFDAEGLARLLARIRQGGPVSAPAYSRELHEPVPGAIDIPVTCRIVIVEGNYLGLGVGAWSHVRAHMDWLWRLDVPWAEARARLIARRTATGRDADEATAWVDTVDAANAVLVASSPADAVLAWNGAAWAAEAR